MPQQRLPETRCCTHPTKEQVRAYLAAPARKLGPPPPLDEIRRQLGWSLLPLNGNPQYTPIESQP